MLFPKMRELRSEKLIERIVEKYPWSLTECIEVFVPEAWFDLVMETIPKLEERYKEAGIPFDEENFGITQIKEKFGLLRIYIDRDKIEKDYLDPFVVDLCKILDDAEFKSMNICAICGSETNRSEPDGHFYPLTKCPQCSDKKASTEA